MEFFKIGKRDVTFIREMRVRYLASTTYLVKFITLTIVNIDCAFSGGGRLGGGRLGGGRLGGGRLGGC